MVSEVSLGIVVSFGFDGRNVGQPEVKVLVNLVAANLWSGFTFNWL
jgi:hypothetical protein